MGKDEFGGGGPIEDDYDRVFRLAMGGVKPAAEGVPVAEISFPASGNLQQDLDDAKAALGLYLSMGSLRSGPEYNRLWDELATARYRLDDQKEREAREVRRRMQVPYREDLKRILKREPTDAEVEEYIDDPKTPKYRQVGVE